MVSAWGWKIRVVCGIAHFFSLINICVDSSRSSLEVASVTLLWDVLTCKLLACTFLCVINYFLFLYSWKKWGADLFSNEGIHILLSQLGKQRVTVMLNFPPHLWLQISWLQLQAVWQRWNERSLECVAGRAVRCPGLCLRSEVHLGLLVIRFVRRHLSRRHDTGFPLQPGFCVHHTSSTRLWADCGAGKRHQPSFTAWTQ